MNHNFNQYPFLRIIIAFVAGIVVSEHFSIGLLGLPLFLLFFLLYIIFAVVNNNLITYSTSWIRGLLLLICFFIFGWSYTEDYIKRNTVFFDNGIVEKAQTFIVRVINDVEVKKNSVKTIVETEAIVNDKQIEKLDKARIIVFISKDSLSEQLRYGDRLLIHTLLNNPEEPKNPYAFDYKKYLYRQGITYQAWVKHTNWRLLSRDNGNKLVSFSLFLRKRVLNILQKHLGETQNYQVAAAVLVGYRANMDADLRNSFARAGAMHVMCVSGLHVGVIYVFLNYILFFLSKRKLWHRIIKTTSILIFIWFYAMLTGFSASVLRASTMFSFIALGNLFEKRMPIYNSIASSAFILLFFNPMNLYNIGFQLSYLAVIGIVAIYPVIKQLLPTSNSFLIKVRDLIAISIAAQIATAPISLYYFNQFPNYFILTNIVVVPLSSLIIYSAIPTIFLSGIDKVADFAGIILSWQIKIMNDVVSFIEKLPGAVSEFVYFNSTQVVLTYLALILLFVSINLKNFKVFLASCGLAIVIISISSFTTIKAFNNSELIYPHYSQSTLLNVEGQHCYVISHDTTLAFKKDFLQNFSKYISLKKIKNVEFKPFTTEFLTNNLYLKFPYVAYNQKYIFFPDEFSTKFYNTNILNKFNYIIIENNIKFYPQKITTPINSMFVIGATNKKYLANRWEKQLKEKQVFVHNIHKEGFLRIK